MATEKNKSTKAIKQTIRSKAPTRVDLAGGTIDIWPIYLFIKRPTTVNLAIDLYAEAQIECDPTSAQDEVRLRTEDQKNELVLKWKDLDTFEAPPSLSLHLKFLRHFAEERKRSDPRALAGQFTLSTIAKSPAGAGLGGSSTLSIAMIGALAHWARGGIEVEQDGEELIGIARDTETTVIQVPAGLQDYYGAMFGGLQSLKWKAGSHERKWQSDDALRAIEDRLLLFYSGQSRNSGINNWALFKNFIDRQGDVRQQFESIAAATLRLEDAIERKDWQTVGVAISQEWEVRRKLAPGISTPEMDQAFATAQAEGATAGKICGAGGGGCFFVYVPSGDMLLKTRIRDQIVRQGIRDLDFRAVSRGLEVEAR